MISLRNTVSRGIVLVIGYLGLASQGRAGDPAKITHRVNSRMVLVPVTVTDGKGKTITDLRREQFQVLDDSTPVEIVSFSREEAPVSIGIVLDLSGSMHTKRRHAITAIKEIIKRAGPKDEAFLMTFSDRPEMRVGFTDDVEAVLDPLLFTGAKGSTALIDGVYAALQKMKRAKNPRRVLVVVSDGGDNNSRYTEPELTSLALESDTQIYSISIHEAVTNVQERSGVYLLSKLSENTGGLHFVVRDRRQLPEFATRLATAINNLYVIGYRAPEGFLSGKWRRVKIRMENPSGGRLRVATRSGYFPD
ncbi:MAG: VWA domain-containing protein [Candidatus Solibacter sp.]